MRLQSVRVYRVKIPFKQPFAHANAVRREADNVVVRCETTDHVVGWGETIARDYVTGETTEGTIQRLSTLPRELWESEFHSADDIQKVLLRCGLEGANVARCGLEIALLDALARERNIPLHALFDVPWRVSASASGQTRVRYGGPFGLHSRAGTIVAAAKLRVYGFRDVKLKLGRELRADRARINAARTILGRAVDLRVDANEAWDLRYALDITPYLRRAGVSAVEQPFPKQHNGDIVEFSQRSGFTVIADESLCSEADARALLATGAKLLFAVKLAKLGGFFSTLRVLALAAQNGVDVQIGCQVGESAILSAAGRQLAIICPNLRYLEGSHDRFLLADNVIPGDITFGWGGFAPILEGAGLGIEVSIDRVERLSVQKLQLYARKSHDACARMEEV